MPATATRRVALPSVKDHPYVLQGLNALKVLRAIGDMSQQDAAAASGCDQQTISRIENGAKPNLTDAVRLKECFGIPVEYWLERDGGDS